MLASILLCLPVSNGTVERLFSIMGVVKTKIRNSLATPMVEAILFVRYSLKRRSETCADCIILPQMLTKFNYNQDGSSSFHIRDSRHLEFKTTNSNLIKLVTTHLQSTLEQRKAEIEQEIVQFEL